MCVCVSSYISVGEDINPGTFPEHSSTEQIKEATPKTPDMDESNIASWKRICLILLITTLVCLIETIF